MTFRPALRPSARVFSADRDQLGGVLRAIVCSATDSFAPVTGSGSAAGCAGSFSRTAGRGRRRAST